MNPQWTQNIYRTVKGAARRCPHCRKVAAYPRKAPGQFYVCQHCRRRFQERGKRRH